MRRQLATCMVTVVLAIINVPAAAQTKASDRPADAAAIRAHIESIFQAFVDKDQKKLEATHGAEWRGFTPWSDHVIRGRDGYMNEATFPPGIPKNQGMVGYRIGQFDIVFYGDTAVVSFMADVDRMNGTQKSVQKLTLLDVYHKDPGGWIQVASNTSLQPDEVSRQISEFRRLGDDERTSLMTAREAVWRAWFAGDEQALLKLLPPELVTIEPAGSVGTRESTLAGSRGFAAAGGKLTRLAFPTTEIQAYGNTAILYTSYEMDLQSGGQTHSERGMATEVFVRKDGRWLNTGWQLAPAGK
ncbi:MAG TPA: nuclear transport factor 2 family protein [Vicinamibacterales bacterium]|nr:nuclear transport factor 2 family protein [Vicinamibacterales bacterium]